MSSLKTSPILEGGPHVSIAHRRRARSSLVVGFILIALSTIIASRSFTASWQWMKLWDGVVMRTVPSGNDFDWDSVTPSEKLKWVGCYEKFECTRLSVPLDHYNSTAGEAAIAIVRYPSVVPRNEEGYLGPVLFNPGGPGGSGIQLVLGRAELLQSILGEGYDLIGFDPRGLGFTTPTLMTLEDREQAMFHARSLRTVNSSDTALSELYANEQILGNLAKTRMEHVAQFVSTPMVARDMLSIVRAHGHEKLQYWGFSYGTVLGATFAAMFPDHVGRVVIDGVVDSEDYYAGTWLNNLRDADATLFRIYQACVDVGPLACPIYENSAAKIHGRILNLLAKLHKGPITFFNATTGVYGTVDYSLLKRAMLAALYKPFNAGKNLAFAIADLERGDAEPLYQLSEFRESQDELLRGCSCPAAPRDPWLTARRENTYAIACGDAEPLDEGVDELRQYFDDMAEQSLFSETWYPRIGCATWRVRTKERFTASFKTNTSFPLLLIGNTADPVTPLWNAHKMSRGFKDSVVLTQDSPGHCSLAAASVCTTKAIRAYFQKGTLPQENTVCDIESTIFGEPARPANLHLTDQDRKLSEASHALQQNYFVPIL